MVRSYILLILLSVSPSSWAIELIRTPSSISSMMIEVAGSIRAARADNIPGVFVEIPLPVTGGTELDDWPGGIRQKYLTLVPMLRETMKVLQFTPSEMNAKTYLGECGEEDSVGLWKSSSGISICCFPTEDSISALETILRQSNQDNSMLVVVNQNFFISPLSSGSTKRFAKSMETAYKIENVNSKGIGGISVRGLVYRKYPDDWLIGRRVDDEAGEYEVILREEGMPERSKIDETLLIDSRVRDGSLSLIDRLKRSIPRFD